MNSKENDFSRRKFLQLSASFGVLASLGNLDWANAAPVNDYKALVCIFLFGGNDGHNTIVPMNAQQYAAYQAARGGSLTLAQNALLPVNDVQGTFGLHPSLVQMQALYAAGRAAVVANVGMLAGPTTFGDLSDPTKLPTNLRSHSDQVVQMQTGSPNAGGPSGWGGRAADSVMSFNTAATFPVSISMNGPAIFCAGNSVPAASLQPGNILSQNAMSLWPASAGQARAAAQQQIAAAPSGNQMIDAANRQLNEALALNPLLAQAQSNTQWNTSFPQTALGRQLQDIARIIKVRAQLSVGRQVFFVGLGGFDTHSGQSYQQGVLLQELDACVRAFYDATVQVFAENYVTTFTMSDFGRTLQPSGTGSDHGWGSHHFVVGGAVQGSKIYGTFPLMTNYANLNASAEDYADNRGVLLPRLSLSQYGATLAKWFGADPLAAFPNLGGWNGATDLGFMG
jgi:uncharacterized protein (DUF1501 family)